MSLIDRPHDPFRHLNYLRQSLSQDKESIGFFLSAGCPLAVRMPQNEWPLIPDVKSLTAQIAKSLSDNSDYQKLTEEIKKAGKNPENVEDILSFLRSLTSVATGGEVRGFNETQLINLEKAICKEIVKKVDVPLPQPKIEEENQNYDASPYHKLGKWINSITRNMPIELFTTNYDLLMEQALEDQQIPFFDGFVGSRKPFFDLRAVENNLIPEHWVRLWKIHGSINWQLDRRNERTEVYRVTEVQNDANHLIYPSHLKYDESRKMPYLALIDKLGEFVRRKSSLLIICGYSFNDYHLNDVLITALKANPTAMVLALMFGNYSNGEGKECYPEAYRLAKDQHNLNIWTDDKAIIGTNPGDWFPMQKDDEKDLSLSVFVDPPTRVSETVSKSEEANPTSDKYQVKLGDFAKFTDFLQKMIGHHHEQ